MYTQQHQNYQNPGFCCKGGTYFKTKLFVVEDSVGDSNLDLHVFKSPRSGTISQRIWILPFSHKGVERAEIMLAKIKF
jgi:hypothetical protein